METIEIENFSGIKHIKVEIRRLNVLIGEQATGKSILAKMCYLFKSFPNSIYKAVENEDDKRSLDKAFLDNFSEYFPEVAWGKTAFKITYKSRNELFKETDEFIKIHKKSGMKPKLEYSEFYIKQFKKLKTHYSKLQSKTNNTPDDEIRGHGGFERWENLSKLRAANQRACRMCLGASTGGSQLFIPAGRSFFANLENNIFSFLSSNNQIDPFLRNFGSYYETIKDQEASRLIHGRRRKRSPRVEELIATYTNSIIRGKYQREKRKDYIITSDSRKVPVSISSSGQQETLPLLLILNHLANTHFNSDQTVYIEEPEAHLFPRAQKVITDFIALAHTINPRLQVFITTHSPYILTCLNNIIQRGETMAPEEELTLPSIKIKEISAHSLSSSGAIDLIDKDEGLIDASIIDEVSDELAREFEELL